MKTTIRGRPRARVDVYQLRGSANGAPAAGAEGIRQKKKTRGRGGSALELAVAADDRQVGEIKAGVVGRAVADIQPAKVEFVQLLERGDHLFARWLGGSAAQ